MQIDIILTIVNRSNFGEKDDVNWLQNARVALGAKQTENDFFSFEYSDSLNYYNRFCYRIVILNCTFYHTNRQIASEHCNTNVNAQMDL